MAEKWESIGRPGYLGKHRDNKHFLWNQLYGEGNWRLAWNVGERFVDKAGAYVLYEEAYFQFFAKNMNYAHRLIKDACEPELIVCLETVSWWYKGTIESWYQNNKYLQAKT